MRFALALATLALTGCAVSPADDPPQDRWLEFHDHQGPGRKKHIVWIAGDDEYRSEQALPMLAHMMAKRHGFDCTVLFSQDPTEGTVDPTNRRHIVGLELLAHADLVVLFTRYREWDPDEMRFFDEYLRAGGPLIGLRTATHAFEAVREPDGPYAHYAWDGTDPEGGFGRVVLGTTWVGHHGEHGEQSTRAVVDEAAADHPILRGVGEVWAETDVYEVQPLPANATVLMRGVVLDGLEPTSEPLEDQGELRPVAWAREQTLKSGKRMRVVATTMGSARDFRDENLRRLLVNSCYWALGMDDLIPELADARPIEWYAPSASGLGRQLRGLQPVEMRPASRGVHRW